MLERLIYLSKSLQPLPLDLKDILAKSRAKNPKAEITGALCFIDGVYLQYLEGEAAALSGLYAKIEKDPRHTDTKLLLRSSINERLFRTWSMALLTLNEETRKIIDTFVDSDGGGLENISPEKAAGLMRSLAVSSNWATV